MSGNNVRAGQQQLTRMDRLLALIEAEARAGRPCPTNATMADMLGVAHSDPASVLGRAVDRGLIRIHIKGRIRIVEAADGSWRTAEAMPPEFRSHGGCQAREELQPRLCLRCRKQFEPAHRHNFLCDYCGSAVRGSVAA